MYTFFEEQPAPPPTPQTPQNQQQKEKPVSPVSGTEIVNGNIVHTPNMPELPGVDRTAGNPGTCIF